MNKVNKLWFIEHLADLGMSQRSLAKRLGIDPSSLTNTLNGKRQLKLREAGEIAGLLGVDVNAVLEAAGLAIRGVRASGAKNQGKGRKEAPRAFKEGWVDGEHGIHIPTGKKGDKDRCEIRLRLKTQNSSIAIWDGALVKTKAKGSERDFPVGRLSLIWPVLGEPVLGFLVRGYEKGKFNILGLNSHVLKTGVLVEIAIKVISIEFV